MRRQILGATLIAGLLATAGPALTDEAPVSGSLLAFQCAGCHGYNGHSVGPATPSLAGFPKDYFVETMLAYQESKRYATIMDRVAIGYTKEEFEAMAGFFADQPYLPAHQPFDAELAARGKGVHDQHCESCHSGGGTAAEDDVAPIAGQWKPYLRDSFEDFMVHGRPQPRGMERRLSGLSDEDREALIHFYASQQDPAAYAN
jgi:cytochrome subunit of sulfide dehydrogenase